MAVNVWLPLQNSTDVKSFLGLCGFLPEIRSGLCHGGYTADQPDGEESCVEIIREIRTGLPGVEGQVVAIPGVDGA